MSTSVNTNSQGISRIVAWNANGIRTRMPELGDFLQENQIDVALLNETCLRPEDSLNVVNYKTYRRDRLTGRGGGTAVFVKNSIRHSEVVVPPLNSLEAAAVIIRTDFGPSKLYATYRPPSGQDFYQILTDFNPMLMPGDLNAKHHLWGSRTIRAEGSCLTSSKPEDFRTILFTATRSSVLASNQMSSTSPYPGKGARGKYR